MQSCITFHGLIEDHAEVERILSRCAIGLAPYEPAPGSFTPFADPGKPKDYLACGLPVLITDVPRVARQIAEAGAGRLIEYTPESLRDAVVGILTDEQVYRRMRECAIELGARFDWTAIFADALDAVGVRA
jgi:glycosyltransferase involved in cell wall biosynthesis